MTDSGRGSDFADSRPTAIPPPVDQRICVEELGRLLDQFRTYLTVIAASELPESLRCKMGASDIVQDTIVKGLRYYGDFKGATREELAGWLRSILLNLLANNCKAFQTQKRDLQLEQPIDNHLTRQNQPSPSGVMVAQEQADLLERTIASLPPESRDAILLRHRENLSFAEIGQRLQKSEEAARKTWARAVKQLQLLLQETESRLKSPRRVEASP